MVYKYHYRVFCKIILQKDSVRIFPDSTHPPGGVELFNHDKGYSIPMQHGFLLLMLFLIALAGWACSNQESPTFSFDANYAPITEGMWYQPELETNWHWQLTGEINTSYDVEMYDIDLFDTSQTQIQSLQEDGIKVICYFSAGSGEDWRTDYSQFMKSDLGKAMEGWDGEYWLDIRSKTVMERMIQRLDLAQEKGCDGVEPDNVDGYSNDTGFDLTYADQVVFNKHLANEAHRRNLAVGLKNSGDQIPDLLEYYDFSLNEECYYYEECRFYSPFITAGKPVFHAEYEVDDPQPFCEDMESYLFSTLILPWDLDDSFRISCQEL